MESVALLVSVVAFAGGFAGNSSVTPSSLFLVPACLSFSSLPWVHDSFVYIQSLSYFVCEPVDVNLFSAWLEDFRRIRLDALSRLFPCPLQFFFPPKCLCKISNNFVTFPQQYNVVRSAPEIAHPLQIDEHSRAVLLDHSGQGSEWMNSERSSQDNQKIRISKARNRIDEFGRKLSR